MNTILQFRKQNKKNNNVYCNELSRDDSLRQKKTAATALKTSDQVIPRPILKKKNDKNPWTPCRVMAPNSMPSQLGTISYFLRNAMPLSDKMLGHPLPAET